MFSKQFMQCHHLGEMPSFWTGEHHDIIQFAHTFVLYMIWKSLKLPIIQHRLHIYASYMRIHTFPAWEHTDQEMERVFGNQAQADRGLRHTALGDTLHPRMQERACEKVGDSSDECRYCQWDKFRERSAFCWQPLPCRGLLQVPVQLRTHRQVRPIGCGKQLSECLAEDTELYWTVPFLFRENPPRFIFFPFAMN